MTMTGRRHDCLWECIDPDGPGIFSALADLGVPWAETYDGGVLDEAYMLMYSGGKRPSPVVSRMAGESGGYLTQAQIARLARMIWSICGESWSRVWDLEISEYDPISNYDMHERISDERTQELDRDRTTTYGRTNTRTDNLSDTYGTTDTRTDNLSLARTGTDSTSGTTSGQTETETERRVYGLNSETGVPSDQEVGTSTSTETETQTLTHATTDTHTGTQTNARTGSDTHTGTQTHTAGGADRVVDSDTTSETRVQTTTRTGNIGTMTTQDMIKQEREIREWKLFYDRVFPDVDRSLVLSVY